MDTSVSGSDDVCSRVLVGVISCPCCSVCPRRRTGAEGHKYPTLIKVNYPHCVIDSLWGRWDSADHVRAWLLSARDSTRMTVTPWGGGVPLKALGAAIARELARLSAGPVRMC